MQKLCCVRTRQQSSASLDHLSQAHLLVSPSILIHFWWELYHKPTNKELVKYLSVHLTIIHEWDPSVLDFSYPEGDEEPAWACNPQHVDLIDPNFDPQELYTKRAINTLSSLADVHKISPMAMPSSTSPTHACKHHIKSETPDLDKYRP